MSKKDVCGFFPKPFPSDSTDALASSYRGKLIQRLQASKNSKTIESRENSEQLARVIRFIC